MLVSLIQYISDYISATTTNSAKGKDSSIYIVHVDIC